MANKRIRDLSERTTFSSGDYLATDNSSGTRKVDASKILTPISTAQSTADLVTSRVSNSGDAFSSSKGYDVGDLVVAPTDNLIYRCKTAYSTGASWNSRKANFEQISVVKAVDTLNAALNNIIYSSSTSQNLLTAFQNACPTMIAYSNIDKRKMCIEVVTSGGDTMYYHIAIQSSTALYFGSLGILTTWYTLSKESNGYYSKKCVLGIGSSDYNPTITKFTVYVG